MVQPLSPETQLEWRVRLMGAGALIALVGIYFDVSWLIWIAIAVLALGFVLRFARRDDEEPMDNEGAEDGE